MNIKQSNKSISIIGTLYKSDKYILNYLKNITSFDNVNEIIAIVILNNPSNFEIEVSNKYKLKYKDIFHFEILPFRESISESINRGLKLANTDFVSFLDVDDMRKEDSYLLQLKTFISNPEIEYTYGDFVMVDFQGSTTGKAVKPIEFDRNKFIKGCYTSPTWLIKKQVFDKIGFFDEQYLSGGDFEFQARAALAGINFKKTNQILYYRTEAKDRVTASCNNILQPIERTVTELRYGSYNKIDFRYLNDAIKYRIYEIKRGEKWIPITDVIPDYEYFLLNKIKYLEKIFYHNVNIQYWIRTIKNKIKLILR